MTIGSIWIFSMLDHRANAKECVNASAAQLIWSETGMGVRRFGSSCASAAGIERIRAADKTPGLPRGGGVLVAWRACDGAVGVDGGGPCAELRTRLIS